MIIGIDARSIFTQEITGVGNYVMRLAYYLQEKNYRLILFTDKIDHTPGWIDEKKTKIAFSRAKNRYLWEQITLLQLLKKYPVDIYHAAWNHGIPFFYKGKTVLTVYDIIPIVLKKMYNNTLKEKINFLLYKASLYSSIAKTNHIITISDSSKKDISKYFPMAQYKITSIYLGCDASRAKDIDDSILTTIGIGKRFIVYFGGFEKRKNVESLIEAFIEVNKIHTDAQLVLIGKKNPYYRKYLSKYKHPNIIFTDYLNNNDLYCVAGKAVLSVYPSIYEGFGLPVIEAMKLGVPAITSKNSSLAEIAGGCAFLIDHPTKEQIKDAIIKLLNNLNLRANLKQKGMERAKKFNWADTIEQTISIYNKTLSV